MTQQTTAERIWEEHSREFSARQAYIQEIHLDLLRISVDMGAIHAMPHWMSSGLAARIFDRKTDLYDLTLGELTALMMQQERMHAAVEKEATHDQQ